jgi:hypothetical protein
MEQWALQCCVSVQAAVTALRLCRPHSLTVSENGVRVHLSASLRSSGVVAVLAPALGQVIDFVSPVDSGEGHLCSGGSPNVTLEDPSEIQLRWRIHRQDPNSGCAGGSVAKIPILVQLYCNAGGSVEKLKLRSAAYAGRSTCGREDDQEDGLVELSRTRATRTQANGLIRGGLSSRPS